MSIHHKLMKSRRLLVMEEIHEGEWEQIVALAKQHFPKATIFTKEDALADGLPQFMADAIGEDWIEVYPPCTNRESDHFLKDAEPIITGSQDRELIRATIPIHNDFSF